ncbi:MAG: hypothetical protein J6Y53_06215 [Alphaproteobacteria bacterium]|nr:hypothetical protein [Alphaproteobacteria bacterium]
MGKVLLFAIAYLFAIRYVYAQLPQYQGEYDPNQTLQEYFAAEDENYNKSIIYVFYNNNYCYGCPQAIDMLENLYQRKYTNKYSFFIINYQNDEEYNFVATYNLTMPLEVVLVKIEDGNSLGYEKIEYLQDMISDKISFDDYVSYKIDSFLGN